MPVCHGSDAGRGVAPWLSVGFLVAGASATSCVLLETALGKVGRG